MFNDLIKQGKETAARALIAPHLEPAGEIVSLNIDSANKKLGITLRLKGEPDLVEIRIDHYEIIKVSGEQHFKPLATCASKEWMAILLKKHVENQTFPIPLPVAMML